MLTRSDRTYLHHRFTPKTALLFEKPWSDSQRLLLVNPTHFGRIVCSQQQQGSASCLPILSPKNHHGSDPRVLQSLQPFLNMSGITEKVSRLQRKTSSNDNVKKDKKEQTLPDSIIRASPSEFAQDYSIPRHPAPSAIHPALRPPAARNASSGNLRALKSAGAAGTLRSKASTSSLRFAGIRPRSPNPAYASTIPMDDRPQATPPLPTKWTVVHDRAICVLDARGYTLQQTISKLRHAFPELIGSVMTPMMIDKRLRVLDQNPKIDYFKIGMKFSSKRSNVAGDTTVLDKIPSVRPISDRPPQIASSPRNKRAARTFKTDDKENFNPANSAEHAGELPNSLADALDGVFLDETVLVSVILLYRRVDLIVSSLRVATLALYTTHHLTSIQRVPNRLDQAGSTRHHSEMDMFLCVLQQCDEEIVRVNDECLALCTRYLTRFGSHLGSDH